MSKTARKVKPYLGDPLILALDLIESLEKAEQTFDEVATDTGINKESCKQMYRALARGGYPIELATDGKEPATLRIRPATIARKTP